MSDHTLTIKIDAGEVKYGSRHSAADQAHLDAAVGHLIAVGGQFQNGNLLGDTGAGTAAMHDNPQHPNLLGDTNAAAAQAKNPARHPKSPFTEPGTEWDAGLNDTGKALVFQGTEAKALGNGLVGGYLVRYGDAKKTDLTGDFFNDQTDTGEADQSVAYYHHGLDKALGKSPLKNKATIGKDSVGVWIKHQLDLRSEYEKAIYGLAEQKKLGWSSGTAAHLVEREQVGNAMWIKRWPLGLDASYTPTPAEPRNTAQTLKSYVESLTPAEQPALKSAQEQSTDYYSMLFNR